MSGSPPDPSNAPARSTSAPVRAGVLPLLLLASTLTVMAGSLLAPVIELIRGDLGVSGTAAGLLVTTHSLAIAVASPLAGRLIDRYGVRTPLAAGLVIYGLAGGAGLIATSYPALLLSRFVFGVGAALVFGGTTFALLTFYQGHAQDRAMGWRGTATSLGGILWPLGAGAVGGISWHLPFGLYLIGVPLGLATAMLLPRGRPVDALTGEAAEQIGTFAMLRRYRSLLAWYGLMFLASVLLYALVVFLPGQLAATGVSDPLTVSYYTVAMSAVMSVVGLVYAPLRERLGSRLLLYLALGLWAPAFLILAFANQPRLLLVAPVLFGLGNGVFFPVVTLLVSDAAPAGLRGRAISLSGTATFVGQFASPLMIGPLIQATSTTAAFLVAAVLPLIALLALVLAREPRAAQTPAEV